VVAKLSNATTAPWSIRPEEGSVMSELNRQTARPLSGLRILVVEDETMLFFLAEDMLTELGCSAVLHACRVKDALALLAQQSPDVAMLDVNLAGEQAYPIAEKLAAQKVPFVFATGYGSEGIPAGWAARPVIQKPFTLNMLERAIAAALASANA
jgi:CheY-like chemotaxis protein